MTNEELVALIQAGERDKLPELWEQVERFVAWKASKLLTVMGDRIYSYGVEFNDLYNSGYFALVDAVESYKPESGNKFTTWLAFHLKNTFAKTGGWYGKTGDRQKALDPLNKESTRSMDAPVKGGADDGDKAAFCDLIADPRALQALRAVDEGIFVAQRRQAVQQALEQLPVEERLAVKAYYYEGRTKQEAGRETLERAELHLRRMLSKQREDILA